MSGRSSCTDEYTLGLPPGSSESDYLPKTETVPPIVSLSAEFQVHASGNPWTVYRLSCPSGAQSLFGPGLYPSESNERSGVDESPRLTVLGRRSISGDPPSEAAATTAP